LEAEAETELEGLLALLLEEVDWLVPAADLLRDSDEDLFSVSILRVGFT
jgi:hypothetical protein